MSEIHYPAGIKPKAEIPHKTPTKSKRKLTIAAGNRGMDFESEITETNLYYREKGLALFDKRPTPINVVKVDYTHGPKITEAYFKLPSTTDYNGIYRNRYIDFDRFNIEDYGSKMEVRNALESFLKWYKKFTKHHTYNVKFTEFVVVGKHLGGTIDCGIDGWKDPNKVIFVDYKTSGDFYLTQFLQLAAYVMIYEEVYGPDTVEGVMVIRMDKKGKKGEARFLPRKRLDDYITCFQCLYDVTMGVKFLNANFREDTEIF